MVHVYNSISIVYAGVFIDIYCEDPDRRPSQLVPDLDQTSWINIYILQRRVLTLEVNYMPLL